MDFDLVVLVAQAFLKPCLIMNVFARYEEDVNMHKHRDLRTIGTLLVEHAWVIRIGRESIASHSSAWVRAPQDNGFDTPIEILVEHHDGSTSLCDKAGVLGLNVDEKARSHTAQPHVYLSSRDR
jgi:hypothetical protein